MDGVHPWHCLGSWLLPKEWKPGMPLPSHHAAIQPDATKCTGTFQGMGPTDITTAYNVPASSSAGGKIVALIDLADKTAFGDLTGYRSAAGLKALPQCTGSGVPGGAGKTACFAQVDSETGAVTNPTTSVSTDADGETALDMAMVSAACPDCSIVVVALSEASSNLTGDNGWQGFVDAVKTAKNVIHASAVSISFGGPEDTDPNLESLGESNDGGLDFTGGYTSSGTPVFVAAGDFAYLNQNIALDDAGTVAGASPSYPASAPDVIAVGGTMLVNTGSGYDEAVWDDGTFGTGQNGQDVTTSGCSTEFAMPSWQSSALSGTGCSKRATADIAAAAAFTTGGQSAGIALCAGGQLSGAEGTSAASPMVAAIFTRIGLTETLSKNLGWIYESPTGFHDLGSTSYPVDTSAGTGSTTDAQNPSTCGKLCTAGPGWDGPSGMGTPNATVLAGLPTDPPGSSSGGSSSGGSSSGGATDGGASSGGSGSGGGSSSGASSSGGGSSSGASSSGGSSSGGLSGSGSGGSGSGGSGGGNGAGSSGGGSGSSGCSVVTTGAEVPSAIMFGAVFGVAAFGARRRRKRG
jgi:MYXO-CTERM domain-containing protein